MAPTSVNSRFSLFQESPASSLVVDFAEEAGGQHMKSGSDGVGYEAPDVGVGFHGQAVDSPRSGRRRWNVWRAPWLLMADSPSAENSTLGSSALKAMPRL